MCLMDTLQLDRTKTDAFAERMLGVLNNAATALSISIGHRTGLYTSPHLHTFTVFQPAIRRENLGRLETEHGALLG